MSEAFVLQDRIECGVVVTAQDRDGVLDLARRVEGAGFDSVWAGDHISFYVPILESLTARPPLDATLDEETEARLPLLFGGISVALARTFKLIDAELKAVHSEEWERTFSLFRLLI